MQKFCSNKREREVNGYMKITQGKGEGIARSFGEGKV